MAGRKSNSFWSSLAQIWSLVGRGQRREVAILVALTVIGAFSEMVTIGAVVPFLALLASGSSGAHLPRAERVFAAVGAETADAKLLAAAILLAVAAVASGLLRLLLVRKTRDFACAFGHRLSVDVQRRMLLQPYAWHVRHNSSEQLAAIEKADFVTNAVLLPLVQAFAAAVLAAGLLLVLLKIAPFATVVAAVALGFAYYAIGAIARKRLAFHADRIDSGFGRRIRVVQEGLGGIREVILDGTQERVVDRFRSADWQIARGRADASFVASVPRFLIEPAGIVVIAGLSLFLSQRAGGLVAAIPVLGALALGAQRLLPLVQQLYAGWSNVAANCFIIDDVVERLSLPVAPKASDGPRLPFEKAIEFRGVGYTYADRAHPAVENLSFLVSKGSRVAILGPTGAGKTTTADLLMGLLEPTAGTIRIDGVALGDSNLQSWRANVAHVPQMLFVADATVAENIALSADLDMDRVREAAALAQLDHFVRSLPQGYETRVGERGAQISGGQRQRLAIARAIYKDAPLIVLDEATSALDDSTERAVLGALDELQEQGRTIVVIAHRPTTTVRCDQVLRLEEGRLVGTVSDEG